MRAVLLLPLLLAAAGNGCSRTYNDPVVARVDGSLITREQLDQEERRVAPGAALDPATRRKLLQSLVLDRALASAQERMLTADEMRVVEADQRSHRDQVLARMYLAHHGAALAPSDDEVRTYYQQFCARRHAHRDHWLKFAPASSRPWPHNSCAVRWMR
ncbi:MAG TPA: hypothetical protein VHE37_16180 [Nevskiaceae bacterium]|nr:hypothetical protein [Nevskiaceae bacterium]